MASRVFLMPRAKSMSTIGLGLSSVLAAQSLLSCRSTAQIIRCDAPASAYIRQYERDAKNPVVKEGRVNPRIYRQLSSGSIAGVLGGVAVSMFSKPLALLLGLLFLGVQALESRGIHLVPYKRIQRYLTNTDVKSTLQDNVAFKLSFGLTFLLAGFASFASDD